MATAVKPRQFLVDARGKPHAVVLSLVDYHKLVRLLEDQADAKTLRRAMRASHGTISHPKLLERLKRHHLI